jgi:hypothetical protein
MSAPGRRFRLRAAQSLHPAGSTGTIDQSVKNIAAPNFTPSPSAPAVFGRL